MIGWFPVTVGTREEALVRRSPAMRAGLSAPAWLVDFSVDDLRGVDS